jgi:hypothetical protein
VPAYSLRAPRLSAQDSCLEPRGEVSCSCSVPGPCSLCLHCFKAEDLDNESFGTVHI